MVDRVDTQGNFDTQGNYRRRYGGNPGNRMAVLVSMFMVLAGCGLILQFVNYRFANVENTMEKDRTSVSRIRKPPSLWSKEEWEQISLTRKIKNSRKQERRSELERTTDKFMAAGEPSDNKTLEQEQDSLDFNLAGSKKPSQRDRLNRKSAVRKALVEKYNGDGDEEKDYNDPSNVDTTEVGSLLEPEVVKVVKTNIADLHSKRSKKGKFNKLKEKQVAEQNETNQDESGTLQAPPSRIPNITSDGDVSATIEPKDGLKTKGSKHTKPNASIDEASTDDANLESASEATDFKGTPGVPSRRKSKGPMRKSLRRGKSEKEQTGTDNLEVTSDSVVGVSESITKSDDLESKDKGGGGPDEAVTSSDDLNSAPDAQGVTAEIDPLKDPVPSETTKLRKPKKGRMRRRKQTDVTANASISDSNHNPDTVQDKEQKSKNDIEDATPSDGSEPVKEEFSGKETTEQASKDESVDKNVND